MSFMSTRPHAISTLTSTNSPDPLEAILQRLNGTAVKVSKLHKSLGNLEIELSEILQQCEMMICVRSAAAANRSQAVQFDCDKDAMIMPNSSSHHAHGARISVQDPSLIQWEIRDSNKQEGLKIEHPMIGQKCHHNRMESNSKGHCPTSISPIPDSSSVFKGGNWLRFLVSWSQSRTTAQTQMQHDRPSVSMKNSQIQKQYPPRPPINPIPFPKYIDLSRPPELTHEGHDWFTLFNPSPKVHRILDVTLVHSLRHNTGVTCVKFSQDAKLLATGCQGTARIYDVKTGVMTCVLDHANNVYIWSVCFSPNGKHLATGAGDNQIRIWNIAEKEILNIFTGHESIVHSIHFSPNSEFIVSGSRDGLVHIWDMHDGTFRVLNTADYCLPHSGLHDDDDKHYRVSSIALSPDGRYVAVGSANTTVGIWEVTTGALVLMLRGHKDRVRCVAFTPDGKGLISGSHDKVLKYWDVSRLYAGATLTSTSSSGGTPSSPCLMNFTGHKDNVLSAAVSHDGAWAVSGAEDRYVLFWDMRTGVVQCVLFGHKNAVLNIDLSPRGSFLATESLDGTDGMVKIWNYGVISARSDQDCI